jgi:hypothetical protein
MRDRKLARRLNRLMPTPTSHFDQIWFDVKMRRWRLREPRRVPLVACRARVLGVGVRYPPPRAEGVPECGAAPPADRWPTSHGILRRVDRSSASMSSLPSSTGCRRTRSPFNKAVAPNRQARVTLPESDEHYGRDP